MSTNKKVKKGKKVSKRDEKERLTNWYMINLCWGIVGILGLTVIYRGYRSTSTILYMQPLMWILTGVFAVGAIVLFVLSKCNIVKNTKRVNNYGVFLCICTLVSLWLALYNILRPIIENCARSILGNPNLTVSSYWNVWISMILIAVYLVIAFIWYAIKIARK